jgi:hypothetical protein
MQFAATRLCCRPAGEGKRIGRIVVKNEDEARRHCRQLAEKSQDERQNLWYEI